MSYNVGGLIEAKDYNDFVGTSNSNVPNTVNAVWSVGNGSSGYGQPAVPQVAIGNTVTASQWATMINTLNSLRMHQSGAGTTVPTVVAGDLIEYKNNLQSEITTIYNNRDLHNSLSPVTLGTIHTAYWSSTAMTSQTRTFTLRVTFQTPDAARYFFNAGGELKVNYSATRNGSTTARTDSIIAVINSLGGIKEFAGKSNGGRLGTGGTVMSSDATKGYWTSTYNINTPIYSVRHGSGSYSTDSATLAVKPNGSTGSNGSNGQYIDFILTVTSGIGSWATSADSFGIRLDQSIDVFYPSTAALANTWGTITVTAL